MIKNSILFCLMLICSLSLTAQNWSSHCGNNERNGQSELPGPHQVDTPYWTVTGATQTALGMNIYSFGDLFVTSRVDFTPYSAVIECRSLETGELQWVSPDLGPESILYVMGFNEDAVYAHDYHSNLFYALNSIDGTVKWVSEQPSYTFGPMDGVIYTCERNVIINGDLGSVDESTKCLDKETGEVLWANSNWFAITPNETKAAHGDHLYLITGAINQPKKLTAVDMRSGENLYYSDDLPGDADQQEPMIVSHDGTIFFHRDGGNIFAVQDDGHAFNILWNHPPINMNLFVFGHCVDHDGNLLLMDNGRVYRLDKDDGSPIDSSLVNTMATGRISISSDSIVYINTTAGQYYALSYDLQTTIWSLNQGGNYYAGPSLSKEGVMILCGSGNTIKAYQFEGTHAPVADFRASTYHIVNFDSVSFFDQSSFSLTSWYWEFPGGDPPVSTDQSPLNVHYAQAGTYDVTLIASNEFGSDTVTKPCYIEVDYVVNVESQPQQANKNIFPNPADDFVYVSTEIESGTRITNCLGETVFLDMELKKERKIDCSKFNPGAYIITTLNNEITRSEKLIINH